MGRCFHCIEERLRGVGCSGPCPEAVCCSGEERLFFALRWRYGKVRMTLDHFFLNSVGGCVCLSSEERTKGSLLVVLLDVVAAVPSIPRGVGSARGPAARPPPRLLVAWPEDGNGGGGLGGRRETETDNAVCFEDLWTVPHHREGHESADHRLTKRVCLARPLSVRLESVLKKKKKNRDRANGCCCVSRRHHHRFRPARGGRGSQPRQTLNVSALLSPVLSFLPFHHVLPGVMGCGNCVFFGRSCALSLGVDCGDLGAVTVRESEVWRQRGVEGAQTCSPFPSHPSITLPAFHRAPRTVSAVQRPM